ncbi:hypothetical protein BLA18112_05374 [Burkholderia lata]|uniref:17 kDa surface antigen n=2 Tax=Burkholderia lata (strain ATCC 17760 / DSM 23089 / LMG 22485 / NCIMB 9086 / R18194 / 383) TaxID=482957 RepID=A0A6P2YN69_BURL3|nr:hypothetical protein BLA18112_05374 [Burkholderia lata]
MNLKQFRLYAAAIALTGAVIAPPAVADRKTTNTIIGVGIGALAGALLSNGDPWAALGGAAAGGFVGNVATRDHHHDDRDYRSTHWERGNDRQWNDARRW